MCYENKDALSAGIIVGGWDPEDGPSVYNIPLGGGMFRQPWAIGGSGSTYVYGYCDATYQEGWGKEETIEWVKNSAFIRSHNIRLTTLKLTSTLTSPFTRYVARWFLWRCHSYGSHHGGRR